MSFLFFTFSSFNLQMVDIQVGRGGGGGISPLLLELTQKSLFHIFAKRETRFQTENFHDIFTGLVRKIL
jgi:hypothetical protein